jgi:hypothetical protein
MKRPLPVTSCTTCGNAGYNLTLNVWIVGYPEVPVGLGRLPTPEKSFELNGSAQHLLEVYAEGFQQLRIVRER